MRPQQMDEQHVREARSGHCPAGLCRHRLLDEAGQRRGKPRRNRGVAGANVNQWRQHAEKRIAHRFAEHHDARIEFAHRALPARRKRQRRVEARLDALARHQLVERDWHFIERGAHHMLMTVWQQHEVAGFDTHRLHALDDDIERIARAGPKRRARDRGLVEGPRRCQRKPPRDDRVGPQVG